jgi:hypothetical protein
LIEPIVIGVDSPEAGTERRSDSQLFVNGTKVTSPQTERRSLVQRGFSASQYPFDGPSHTISPRHHTLGSDGSYGTYRSLRLGGDVFGEARTRRCSVEDDKWLPSLVLRHFEAGRRPQIQRQWLNGDHRIWY